MNRPWIGNTIGQLNSWDLRFMNMCKLIASWSKDPSTKVGAVIVDEDNRIVSTGFNGLPRGVMDTPERLAERNTKYKMIVHGERNALLFAQRSLKGCIIYTYPFPPCSACAGMIIQAGITQVIACDPSDEIVERWGEDLNHAALMFDEAHVNLYLADYK